MTFILWDRKTWVEHHPDRYSEAARKEVRMERRAYAPEQNTFFVQFDGKSSDLLWIGDLVEYRLLQHFNKQSLHQEGYQERWQLARRLGFTNGCVCSRPGLLDAGYLWLTEVGHQNGDLVFEPEALFRANSTRLNAKKQRTRRQGGVKGEDAPVPSRDPLLNYKKPQIITRLRSAQQQILEQQQQMALLAENSVVLGARIAELEAKLAELEPYRTFVERIRSRVRQEEHGNNMLPPQM